MFYTFKFFMNSYFIFCIACMSAMKIQTQAILLLWLLHFYSCIFLPCGILMEKGNAYHHHQHHRLWSFKTNELHLQEHQQKKRRSEDNIMAIVIIFCFWTEIFLHLHNNSKRNKTEKRSQSQLNCTNDFLFA